jgi:hypothetical protein
MPEIINKEHHSLLDNDSELDTEDDIQMEVCNLGLHAQAYEKLL